MKQSGIRVSIMAMAVLAALSLGGCGGMLGLGGGSSRAFEITTNRQVYNRGNTGEATIRNTSGERLEYNLCQRRLERRVDRDWITAFEWPTAGGSCTAEARSLNAGQSVNTFFDIPTGVPAGNYRVVFTGLLNDDRSSVLADRAATPSFEVR